MQAIHSTSSLAAHMHLMFFAMVVFILNGSPERNVGIHRVYAATDPADA